MPSIRTRTAGLPKDAQTGARDHLLRGDIEIGIPPRQIDAEELIGGGSNDRPGLDAERREKRSIFQALDAQSIIHQSRHVRLPVAQFCIMQF